MALDDGITQLALSHFGDLWSTLGPERDAYMAIQKWLAASKEGQALVGQREAMLRPVVERVAAVAKQKATSRGHSSDIFGDLKLLLGVSDSLSQQGNPLVAALDYFQTGNILQPTADALNDLCTSFDSPYEAAESPLLRGPENLKAFAMLVLKLEPIAYGCRTIHMRNVLRLILPVLQGQGPSANITPSC